jgi:hypothetical protein
LALDIGGPEEDVTGTPAWSPPFRFQQSGCLQVLHVLCRLPSRNSQRLADLFQPWTVLTGEPCQVGEAKLGAGREVSPPHEPIGQLPIGPDLARAVGLSKLQPLTLPRAPRFYVATILPQ